MKRALIIFALFLLLGTALSILVAWACSIRASKLTAEAFNTGQVEEFLRLIIEPSEFTNFSGARTTKLGWRHTYANVTQGGRSTDQRRVSTIHVYEQGWPILCLTSELRFGDHLSRDSHDGGVFMRKWFFGREWPVAFSPIPLPFITSTLMYGLPLWTLLIGPFELRRICRKRGGRCMRCGYDLRGGTFERCPECGTATASRTMTP